MINVADEFSDGLVPVFPASVTHVLVLALSSVQVRLKDVEEDIEQVILKPEILVGNEGNQMQVAVFTGPSCHMEDLRLDDTVGIVPNPLMIEVECAEYRQEVSIQALHD